MNNDPLTEKVIGCAYTVANTLGHGFWRRCMKMLWRTNYARRV